MNPGSLDLLAPDRQLAIDEVCGQFESSLQAGRQPFGPGLDQQAVRLEPCLLGEGGECIDDLRHFHISRIMEMTPACQARCQPPGVRVKVSAPASAKSLPVQP